MLRLTIVEQGKPSREASFDRFPISIGRGSDNAVVLAGWKVARSHAEIHQLAGGFKLVDKGSLAGTWVNGERVVEYGPLEETDEVIIGGFQLRAHVAVHVARAATLARSEAQNGARVSVPRAVSGNAAAAPARNGSNGAHVSDSLPLVPRSAPVAVPEPARPVPAANDRDLERYLAGFEWRRKLHRMLLETIDLRRKDLRQFSDQALRAETDLVVREILANSLKLPPEIDTEELITDVLDEVVGLGALERLLADANVSEIMVNSADEIFVERLGKLERCRAAFTSDEAIRSVIDRIVAPLGRRIDESSPMVDARLKDGSRVNAIIPPLALRGPTITIRKFNKKLFGVGDYIRLGSANAAMFEFLRICVECRKNIVISGGTGSGKTTLLNILSNLIPRGERIITIEDAAELKLNAPHLVSLEARPSNVEGKGVIAIRDLVRNSLRMRPDRIVVGECRGGEALDMLQAMNTGHDGSMTTAHANSPRDVVSRLEVMTLMAGMDIPMSAVREQIASAVDVIVQQTRLSDGSRRITSITEVTGVENGTVQLLELFRFERRGFGPNHEVIGHYTGCDAVPTFYEDLRRIGVKLDLDVFGVVKPEEDMDERNLVALLLVAAFVSSALLFWVAVRIVNNALERYRAVFTEQAKMNLEQMFLFIDSGQLLTLNGLVIVAAAVLGYLVTGSWVVALVCCGIALIVPRVAFKFFRWRRTMNLRHQLPDAAMLVSGALRAGASAPTAIAQMAAEIRPPISQEFDLFLREQRLGVGFEEALDNLEQRIDLEDMALFGSAMRVSRETGGNLAETLERLAETLRQKLAIEGKIRALTAQGKLQGIIVGVLPFVMMFFLFKLEPEAMSRMFTTWYGLSVIGFIVVMEVIGGLIIKKIVTIDV